MVFALLMSKMAYDITKFFRTAEKIEKRAGNEGKLITNPSEEKLEQLALQHGARRTIYGNLAVESDPNSRAARHSKNSVDDCFGLKEDELLVQAERELGNRRLISIDRMIGLKGVVSRLIVPEEFAQTAFVGGKLFKPARLGDGEIPRNYIIFFYDDKFLGNKGKKLADKDITIRLAMAPDGRVVKFILNGNYTGEYKKGNFAAEEWRVKQKTDGLFLHAGCRMDYLQSASGKGRYSPVTSLFVALSANGKTTLTSKVLATKEGEESWLIQDDGGTLMPNGSFLGFEGEGIYVKTEGVSPEIQCETYFGLMRPDTAMENVFVDERGRPDFFNYSKTSNGRAVIKRRDFMHAHPLAIDAEKVDNLFLITRGPIVPAISRLTREQAVAFMVLGQAMESSAGDPSRAGQLKNEFFYDPFFVGDKAEHVQRFYGILEGNPQMNFYLLNTGAIGEGDAYEKIKLESTLSILDSLLRGGLREWEDSAFGFQVPTAVRRVSEHYLHPKKLYHNSEYAERRAEWLKHSQGIIEQVSGLDKKIREALK